MPRNSLISIPKSMISSTILTSPLLILLISEYTSQYLFLSDSLQQLRSHFTLSYFIPYLALYSMYALCSHNQFRRQFLALEENKLTHPSLGVFINFIYCSGVILNVVKASNVPVVVPYDLHDRFHSALFFLLVPEYGFLVQVSDTVKKIVHIMIVSL